MKGIERKHLIWAGVALALVMAIQSEDLALQDMTGGGGDGWPGQPGANPATGANTVQAQLAAGQFPRPVDLPIANTPQETQVWCWAAVAQQIIMATRGPQATPPQCALVGMAYGHGPRACCQNPGGCVTTGSLEQIQGLIREFGGRGSSLARPTDPLSVYNTLAAGHAIVMAVRSSPYDGHVVVLRGMAWQQTPYGMQPVLFINDPMAYFTQPVPFDNIARYWEAALVIE